ncbi:hypothetical protein [Methylobacter sp. G7]|uniref:hypothetical protein n=1 Tax=Methylobacter sp. G7 TaxID=3230117 RepID=UPI003D8042CA
MKPIIKTLSVRVHDKHASVLNRMAFDVNQVWNAANAYSDEFSWVPVPEVGYMNFGTSAFELMKDLKGIRKERGMIIDSTAVQETIAVHAKARKQFKKNKLHWRCSGGSKKALGWVPFKSGAAKWVNGQVRYAGLYFKIWDSYGLSNFDFRSGCFSQDARGRWYFNIVVHVDADIRQAEGGQIGIDLGLKTTATCSNGDTLARQDCYPWKSPPPLLPWDIFLALKFWPKAWKRQSSWHFYGKKAVICIRVISKAALYPRKSLLNYCVISSNGYMRIPKRRPYSAKMYSRNNYRLTRRAIHLMKFSQNRLLRFDNASRTCFRSLRSRSTYKTPAAPLSLLSRESATTRLAASHYRAPFADNVEQVPRRVIHRNDLFDVAVCLCRAHTGVTPRQQAQNGFRTGFALLQRTRGSRFPCRYITSDNFGPHNPFDRRIDDHASTEPNDETHHANSQEWSQGYASLPCGLVGSASLSVLQ